MILNKVGRAPLSGKFTAFGRITLGLTAVATSTGATPAHNLQKYAPVPMVVAGACPNFNPSVSSGFVSFANGTQIRTVADNFGDSGFEVFISVPTTHTGAPSSTPGPFAPFPLGNITFRETGMPAGGGFEWFASYSDGSNSGFHFVSAVNGNVTIPSGGNNGQSPGAQLTQVQVYEVTPSGLATVLTNNFKLNNSILLGDTTFTDETISGSSPNGFSFCGS